MIWQPKCDMSSFNIYKIMTLSTHGCMRFGLWSSPRTMIFIACNNAIVINSLRPSDAIWRQRTGSTLAQVMACCLSAPSHYLNQCWFIIIKVQWCSSEGKSRLRYHSHQSLKLVYKLFSRILLKSPRGQWVKYFHTRSEIEVETIMLQ